MKNDPTGRTLRTPTDEEIPALLESLAAAGGNTAAFAREHGLSPWKLYEARRAAAGGAPRARRRGAGESKEEPVFARVRIVEEDGASPEPLELILASGHRLRIPVGFDEMTLRRVMEVVTSC